LSWYLAKSWTRNDLPTPPANLPDGPESWQLERKHLEQSIDWARKALGHLLTTTEHKHGYK
jgi:hypothetical protein